MNVNLLEKLWKAVARGDFELDRRGLVVPPLGVAANGVYEHWVNDEAHQFDSNTTTNEGLIYLLVTGLLNGSKLPSWYVALFSANYTPDVTLTASSFRDTASEIVSPTEGYTNATRVAWTPATNPIVPTLTNAATPAEFTIATASSLVVRGAAILSEPAKGAVTGKLLSAAQFGNARTVYDTDLFYVRYSLQLTPA